MLVRNGLNFEIVKELTNFIFLSPCVLLLKLQGVLQPHELVNAEP